LANIIGKVLTLMSTISDYSTVFPQWSADI